MRVPLAAFDGAGRPLLIELDQKADESQFEYDHSASGGNNGEVFMNGQPGYGADKAFKPELPLGTLKVRVFNISELAQQIAAPPNPLCTAGHTPAQSTAPGAGMSTAPGTITVGSDMGSPPIDTNNRLETAIIVLIVIACVILIALIILAICLLRGGLRCCRAVDDASGKNVTYF
jgi:hypothetical protein